MPPCDRREEPLPFGERFFPPSLAAHVSATYRCSGIRLYAGATVTGLTAKDDGLILDVPDKEAPAPRKLEVDTVVADIGIRPNLDLARASGLAANDGILVDRFLQTSHPDIYAAGDVARFFCPALGKQIRVEHEDNANTMGYHAGRAMAGAEAPYDYVPFFYSSNGYCRRAYIGSDGPSMRQRKDAPGSACENDREEASAFGG